METTVFKFLEACSSEMKLKIIAHFWECKCNQTCVNDLVAKFKTSQANISQHLKGLRDLDILFSTKESRTRIYKVRDEVKKNYNKLFHEILKHGDLKKCLCSCATNFKEEA